MVEVAVTKRNKHQVIKKDQDLRVDDVDSLGDSRNSGVSLGKFNGIVKHGNDVDEVESEGKSVSEAGLAGGGDGERHALEHTVEGGLEVGDVLVGAHLGAFEALVVVVNVPVSCGVKMLHVDSHLNGRGPGQI